jgi:uncharacterized protein
MARPKARSRARDDSASRGPALGEAHLDNARADDWANVFTGLGVAGRDKRLAASVTVRDLTWQQAEALYEGDDLASKIIDDPAREMVRKWIDVNVTDDTKGKGGGKGKAVAEAVAQELDRLGTKGKVFDALRWERAFGGSAIIPLIDDGVTDQALPLREESIKGIRGLTVLDCSELYPSTYYSKPEDPKFGDVETYTITQWGPGVTSRVGVRVHETRVLKFPGVQVSKRHAARKNGWGDSTFVRIFNVLSDFGTAWGGTGYLLQDFSQAVFRIRGLSAALESGNEELIRKRLEAIELGRSIVRAAVLDAGDSDSPGDTGEAFERKTTSLAGLPDILDRFMLRLAAAADMPVSRLFGQANGGLGSDDKAGQTWWNERIEALQNDKLLDPITRLVRLILLAKEGPTKGKLPKTWSVSFRPLRQLDPLQEAQRRLAIAQADAAYVDAQVILPEEAAVSRFGGDRFGEDIVLDKKARAAMAEEEPDDEPEEPISGTKPPDLKPKPGAPPRP